MKAFNRSNFWTVLVVFLSILTTVLPIAAQSNPRRIVLKGARLIDGTGRPAIENSVLIVEGDHVVAAGKAGAVSIPKDADVKDVSGKTIMPALINLHGHLGLSNNGADSAAGHYTEENVVKQLNRYLSYGVATVASFGQDEDVIYKLRDEQRAGNLSGARLFTAGRGFLEYTGKAYPLDDRYRPQTAEEARADVRELAAHHPDYVKMWVDDYLGRGVKIKPEIYQAIIDEAHKQHLRVFAHEFYLSDAKALVAAGLDGLAHSVRDQAVDQELIHTMKARGVFLIPTLVRDEVLFAYADNLNWLDDPFFKAGYDPAAIAFVRSPENVEKGRKDPDIAKYRAGLEMAKKNLKTLSDAGVKIAFGTDSGIPTRFPGFFEHRELQLMVEAGLTPMQAIVAATRTNADILGGAKKFGTLQPGMQADFLVLDGNPLDDIHNTEKLAAVWQAGKVVPSVSTRLASGN
ncbi:MAG TPA: amidohydrolase family protein [Candidatus Acidoferrales bacterium]|nr:amidohydrolase family protein [Candidatus Acidoferrales bacterium]